MTTPTVNSRLLTTTLSPSNNNKPMEDNSNKKIHVCVFGASSSNLEHTYVEAAHELGALIAKRGWGCVNGAGRDGLMRALSDGALEAGGEVTGVIPQFMIDNGWAHDSLTRITATADMHERKKIMTHISQAMIALPGGCGTMEELLEIITWRQLKLSPKPIVILNTLGYYDHLVAMLNNAITHGFMRTSHSRLWRVVSTPLEAVDAIEQELHEGTLTIEPKI